MAKNFELLSAVWVNAIEQLPAGKVVTFEKDEPTGIFIGRVRELTEAGEALEIAAPPPAPAPEPEPAPAPEPEPAPAPPPRK